MHQQLLKRGTERETGGRQSMHWSTVFYKKKRKTESNRRPQIEAMVDSFLKKEEDDGEGGF